MTADLDALLAQADGLHPDDDDVAEFFDNWEGRYSTRNLLLLYVQRPDATQLHTYRGWLGEGRQVRKGEKAIRLLAPRGRSGDEPDREDADRKVRVRPIALFDVEQTDTVEQGEADAAA